MLTFLPMEEVERLSALEGAEINKAKEILAFEITKLVHGEEEAQKALDASRAAFSGGGAAAADIPATDMAASEFEGEGKGLITLLSELKLAESNGDARRTIEQGGVSLNGEKVTDTRKSITTADFEDGVLVIQKGKKKFHKIVIK